MQKCKLRFSGLLIPVLATIICFAASSIEISFAQHAKGLPKSIAPVPLLPAPIPSPQISPNGMATFQLVMPKAAKVSLNLEGVGHPIPMKKQTHGTWTVRVPNLAPEYYSYSYDVDGTDVLDPHNVTVKTSFFSTQNVFLVPGHPPMPWEQADVPHGVIHHHFYRSNIVGINSDYYVYTPPGFDPHNSTKYPVLYLLHGYSDDASAWTRMGKANVILDNLIAQGKANPMIVVMPFGYGNMDMISRGWSAWRDPQLISSNFKKFSSVLFQEIMPRITQQYPVSDQRRDRAIAGLSMGGAESLLIGLNRTDYFGYVAGFSAGGIGSDDLTAKFPGITPQTAAGINAHLHSLWIACGTEDALFPANQKLIAWLRQQGLKPTAIATPGRHVWMLWREDLSKFAPLLFQQ